MAKCSIAFLFMYFMYKFEEKPLSLFFVAMGTVGIVSAWFNIATRKDILEYLNSNLYDNIDRYDYTYSVGQWIKVYDNTMLNCMSAAVIISLACIIITFAGSDIRDNMADIFTYLLAVFMPVTTIILSLKTANKYIDPGNLFVPPVEKSVLILASSIIIRKIIKMYMNKEESI